MNGIHIDDITGNIGPDSTFPEGDFRHQYFAGDRKREVRERAEAIARDLSIPMEGLPEKALRFVLSHPAVTAIIPGMRSVPHVETNCALGDGAGLPPAEVEILRKHRWNRNFYRS